MFAVQANGAEITTVEGDCNAECNQLHPLQESFRECHITLQCGYCTARVSFDLGALSRDHPAIQAKRKFARQSQATCAADTGYQNIVMAAIEFYREKQRQSETQILRSRRRKEKERLPAPQDRPRRGTLSMGYFSFASGMEHLAGLRSIQAHAIILKVRRGFGRRNWKSGGYGSNSE